MTTHTLTGFSISYDTITDDVVDVNASVTLELVVPDSVNSLSYTANTPQPGDDPGEQTVDISLSDYNVRLNGLDIGNNSESDVEVSIFEVIWMAGGIPHSTTVLLPSIEAAFGAGRVYIDYVFVIDGDPLPALTNAAQWNAFDGSIIGISIPTGAYGPSVDIPLTSLGGTVSEDDIITGTADQDVFNGGAGDDMITGLGGNDKLTGGAGADELSGGGGKDVLKGSGGNDELLGGNGADKLFGGGGKDVLKGGVGNDILKGDGGRDRLEGGDGKDVLWGGSGNDRMFGGKNNDKMIGGAGNDKMSGGAGNDTFVFGTGKDVVTDFKTTGTFEKIDLSSVASITGFKDLKNHHVSENADGNLVINDGSGNTMTLNDVSLSDIHANDFIF